VKCLDHLLASLAESVHFLLILNEKLDVEKVRLEVILGLHFHLSILLLVTEEPGSGLCNRDVVFSHLCVVAVDVSGLTLAIERLSSSNFQNIIRIIIECDYEPLDFESRSGIDIHREVSDLLVLVAVLTFTLVGWDFDDCLVIVTSYIVLEL
jgi:hypothetical protein